MNFFVYFGSDGNQKRKNHFVIIIGMTFEINYGSFDRFALGWGRGCFVWQFDSFYSTLIGLSFRSFPSKHFPRDKSALREIVDLFAKWRYGFHWDFFHRSHLILFHVNKNENRQKQRRGKWSICFSSSSFSRPLIRFLRVREKIVCEHSKKRIWK